MTILQEYKKALRDIAVADEMMRSGISEDIQIAVDTRMRAMETKEALEVFIGKALEHYMQEASCEKSI